MMKQMLLAQMITEGAEATQSSSALPCCVGAEGDF